MKGARFQFFANAKKSCIKISKSTVFLIKFKTYSQSSCLWSPFLDEEELCEELELDDFLELEWLVDELRRDDIFNLKRRPSQRKRVYIK